MMSTPSQAGKWPGDTTLGSGVGDGVIMSDRSSHGGEEVRRPRRRVTVQYAQVP